MPLNLPTPSSRDADADVDTRALYLGDERTPLIYVATRPGEHDETMIGRVALSLGLPRFRRGHLIRAAGPGWDMRIDRIGPSDPAPLLSILWPGPRNLFVYGVRKTSPIGWADDVIDAGRVAVMAGPPLDWARLISAPDPDSAEGGIAMCGDLLDALGGRLAAAGIMAATVRTRM